jgi:hypothetical protein
MTICSMRSTLCFLSASWSLLFIAR